MSDRSYEVIIVGAGPAGATLGYELAAAGRQVLVLEKARLPRYKPCAGGVTVRAAKALDMPLDSVVQHTVYGVRVTYKKRRQFTRDYAKPLVYMVMRDQFDYLLVKRARDAGATVLDEHEVRQIREVPEGFDVDTDNGPFRCKIIAGADGAGSRVARSLGLAGCEYHAAIVAETVSGPAGRWDSLMGIDMGNLRHGYGWVFPKSECLTTGIGGSRHNAAKLKRHYDEMMTRFGLPGTASVKSHPLPLLKSGASLHRKNALVLGDAAGLLDPVTGEGIYYAVRSAQLAAPVIDRALMIGDGDFSAYQEQVSEEIIAELKAARAVVRVFAWFPGVCCRAIEGNDRLWRASCRLLRGEESYRSLRARLKGLRLVYDLLSL